MVNAVSSTLDLMALNLSALAIPACMFVILLQIQIYLRRRMPRLRGPPSSSWLFGTTKEPSDLGILYAKWEKKYGPVYEIPSSLGSKMLVLADPKALAHFFAKDTYTYCQPEWIKTSIRRIVSSLPFRHQ